MSVKPKTPHPAPGGDPPPGEPFKRLLELSDHALAALEGAEFEQVEALLREREQIIVTSRESSAPGGTTPRKLSRATKQLLEDARRLQEADTRLTLALASVRDRIGHDLAALENGGAARTAYGPKQRGRSTINVIR